MVYLRLLMPSKSPFCPPEQKSPIELGFLRVRNTSKRRRKETQTEESMIDSSKDPFLPVKKTFKTLSVIDSSGYPFCLTKINVVPAKWACIKVFVCVDFPIISVFYFGNHADSYELSSAS